MGRLWDFFQKICLAIVLVAFIPFLLFSAVYPAIAANPAGPTPEPPQECLEATNHIVRSESAATVTATAELEGDGTINITYDSGSKSSLVVSRTDLTQVVDSHGFRDLRSNLLLVNHSASSHWIKYRMKPSSNSTIAGSSYPSGDDWVIAQLPSHKNENVYIEPTGSGYVAASTIYLGNFERASRTVGCQQFEVIIPDDADRSFRVEDRLDDLEVAARGVPGEKYRNVHVFVSPKELYGERRLSGFVWGLENDIVVADNAIDPSVVWMHEYVHTLQNTDQDSDLAWTIEGAATYLSLKSGVETGRITPLKYDVWMSKGEKDELTSNSPLTRPEKGDAYFKGAAVFAQIDADLEDQSERSIYDVFEWLAQHPNAEYIDLKVYLEEVAGLTNETVASYDQTVLQGESSPIEYRHADPDMPPIMWQAISIALSDDFHRASLVLLPLYTLLIGGSWVFNWLKLDPDQIEF